MIELNELFQVVSRLAQKRPDSIPPKSLVEATSKATQVLGHGDEAFGS